MNCKPGDLAIFVRSAVGNEGRIVRCVRLLSRREVEQRCFFSDIVWETDTPVPDSWGEVSCTADDRCLRPIRPGDISDEEVRDLYLPKVPEAA